MNKKVTTESLAYQSGFANYFASEAEKGALPVGQNSPQKPAYGLYAEQLSGTSFMTARRENQRTWLYRIRPSVLHGNFVETSHPTLLGRPFSGHASPEQMRWGPLEMPKTSQDFLDSLVTIAGNGDLASIRGCAIHIYRCNQSMSERYLYNADGEMLLVPEFGRLLVRTELGTMLVSPGEIGVLPCGIRFQILLPDGSARGYACENYGPAFRLPELGPIGANGLANPRDFLFPTASYEDKTGAFELIARFQGKLYRAELNHSPLDVVAWHGNYAPYKYDLSRFQVINTVSFDHCDPSIYTVLSSPSEYAGLSNLDFVVFPARWSVAEHTFRPAYFHRNCMSEYMGLVLGGYEAKQGGFLPGGASLHNRMSGHGPDTQSFATAVEAKLTPYKIENTLAFMFESSLVLQPTKFALETSDRQKDYLSIWHGLDSHFKKPKTD
jgi:homogentisate 1,2-dioxygenase